MPVFHKDNVAINTDAVLLACTAVFAAHPSAFTWQRLVVAMLAHQQAHYMGDTSLIIDAQKATEDEIAAMYEQTKH